MKNERTKERKSRRRNGRESEQVNDIFPILIYFDFIGQIHICHNMLQ